MLPEVEDEAGGDEDDDGEADPDRLGPVESDIKNFFFSLFISLKEVLWESVCAFQVSRVNLL